MSLCRTFMAKLRVFTIQADAESKWEAGRTPNKATRLPLSLDSPAPLSRSIRPLGSDDDSPACKAHRAVSPVIPEVSIRTASSTIVSSATSYAGTATSDDSLVPKPRSVQYSGRPPILPVSIPIQRFAAKYLCRLLSGIHPYPSSAISIVPGFPCFHGLCRSGRFQLRVFNQVTVFLRSRSSGSTG